MILFVVLLLVAGVARAQEKDADTSKAKKAITVPAGFTKQLDVVYTKVGDWDGRMDIYTPPKVSKPTPVIINIHGGGWNHGTKEEQGGFGPFFKAGYAVANIEYRLVQVAKAPGCIEDTRCALIYLIKNAKALNIDIKKIVIMGSSAGGHLALMGGLLENDNRFDTNCPGTERIKVAAIIDKFGITDVWNWGYGLVIHSKSATNWLGTHATDKEFAMTVSPIAYVKKSSPPVFIVHGNADTTVPYQQSVDLHQKLLDTGIKTEFITVDGGKHGNFTPEKTKEINDAILTFLKEVGI
ncbi:acetyl esterase/lipase [Mucilaginibacter gracilis]|uniref:Acetyl esterase/lipase n=2 Tax=Mucilaginibacter gracilis TaxID=423350 RepID=A0A495IW11_9SPHI|nr:acetyl esterase/lipase [Mucilaginibacter gracilis]